MKVLGQLEGAQLEQIASVSPTPTPTGRIYADITAASRAIPKFYDGTAWRSMLMTATTGLVSQNSGTSCTVDWSAGLYQEVVLSNHCLISFSNPQANQEHVLIVTQRVLESGSGYNTPYLYKFNMTDQDSRRQPYQPIGCQQSSTNQVYRWFYSAGIRPAYATIPQGFGNPATLPAAASAGIDISPDSKYISSGHTSSPFQSVYPVYDGGYNFLYGSKNIVTPQTAAAAVNGIVYSPDGQLVVTSAASTPFIQGWLLDRGTSQVVLANAVTIPTGNAQCVVMHPAGLAAGVGHTTTPFMSIYPITANGWGTKYANPLTLPVAQVNSLAFSPLGTYLAAASQTTPFLQVWPFDQSTGFGTVVANPSSLPAGGPAGALGKAVAWRPQSDYIAVGMTTSPYLYIVSFNPTTGTYGATVSTAASGLTTSVMCVQWTPDGQYLLVGNATTPFLWIYDFSAGTIGTAIAYDVSNAGQQVNDMVIHPSGEYVTLSLNASPFIKTYALPRKAKNYVRLIQ